MQSQNFTCTNVREIQHACSFRVPSSRSGSSRSSRAQKEVWLAIESSLDISLSWSRCCRSFTEASYEIDEVPTFLINSKCGEFAGVEWMHFDESKNGMEGLSGQDSHYIDRGESAAGAGYWTGREVSAGRGGYSA